MSDHLQFEETCALYATGALDAAAAAEFERHLRDCPSCRDELEQWRETAHQLTYSLEPQAPPPAVKAALLARLPVPARVVALPRGWALGLTAAVLFVLIGSTYALSTLQAQLRARDGRIAELEAEVQKAAGQVQDLARLQQAVARQQAMIQLLNGAGLETFELVGLKDAPAARARVFWNQEKNVWLFLVYGLPAPPAGKTYQLWYIDKQARKFSAGTFTPAAEPGGPPPLEFQHPPAPQALAAAAVTLEPAGGVPQPTGSVYLIGKPGA